MKIIGSNELMRRLGLRCPIIQAPMAGGGDTPGLISAVGAAGGIGFIGGAYLTPEALATAASEIRAKGMAPFGINLFAPMDRAEVPDTAMRMAEFVAPYFEELGLPKPPAPAHPPDNSEALIEVALNSDAAAFSFTFGLMPASVVTAAKAKGMLVLGTASTVAEAVALEQSGVDAIVAQGAEAGGHRATFLGDAETSLVGTVALVPQIVDAVSIPVIASGGIMDGRGIAAALALGAQAVQMGTAFLTCAEAGIADCYKAAILSAGEDQTRLTRAFSGRPARGIVNRFMAEVDTEMEPLPFPVQNALTRPMRTAASKQGRAEFLSLWAGQGTRLAQRGSAADLMSRLVSELEEAIARLRSSV